MRYFPNPAVAARKNGHFSIFFHIFPKKEQSKKYLPHIGLQYIKLKLMKFHIKCKRNHFVLIKRYALVALWIWVFALNLGGILREFWEILGKYRIFDKRPLGSIGLMENEKGWEEIVPCSYIFLKLIQTPRPVHDEERWCMNIKGTKTERKQTICNMRLIILILLTNH